MPKLLSREEFDKTYTLVDCGLNESSWDDVLGDYWTTCTDQEIYERYVNYLTRGTKLGKLIAGVDE
jgi:hypothetical protein